MLILLASAAVKADISTLERNSVCKIHLNENQFLHL